MNEIGNEHWVNGNLDGLQGNPPVSEHPDYLDGYGRGYAEAETQSANQEWWERNYAKAI